MPIDAFVESQADTAEFELVEGVIVMMTNPTDTHEQIAGDIGAAKPGSRSKC